MTLALLLITSLCGALRTPPDQVEEGFVMSPGGVRLHYRMVGTGRDTLVIIADGPAGHMAAIAPDYSNLARAHHLLFYDQRGSGRSTLPSAAGENSIADHVLDLEAVRMYMGMRKLRLVAHGWGAVLATRYVMEHADRIDRVALVNPLPVRSAWVQPAEAELTLRLGDDGAARLFKARVAVETASDATVLAACRELVAAQNPGLVAVPGALSRLKGNPCDAPPEALRYAATVAGPENARELGQWDFRAALQAIASPVLVVRGEREIVPAASAREWVGSLRDARLLTIAGAGRYPQVESTAAYHAALNTFFAGRWPEGAVEVVNVVAQAHH